ncbi:MAG TPA: transglutaminase-like domain-containing protein [Blastocatellia bacterium]|nr:transglutaminase-like domain-containing protein [Blastocatellia bacterium]
MKRSIGMRLALMVAVAVALVFNGAYALQKSEPKTRSFEFTYRAQVAEVPPGTKELRIWLPYPTTDAHQEVSDITVISPVQAQVYREPRFDDSILYLSIPNPDRGPITVETKFKVVRSEYVKRDYARFRTVAEQPLDPGLETYLQPDRLVPIDGRIKSLANEVTKGKKTTLDKARAIYDYVLANMKYDKSGTGWGNGDIFYACDAKHGNCTDFHALFIGLCRASGIPARFSIGFPLPEKRGEGEIAGYHCWAAFYMKGYGWVPVDASEASKHPEKREYFFGAHDENRVQFSVGRDLVLRPRQSGQPLNYFIYPYVEADGKPIKQVKDSFYFKDLAGEDTPKAF